MEKPGRLQSTGLQSRKGLSTSLSLSPRSLELNLVFEDLDGADVELGQGLTAETGKALLWKPHSLASPPHLFA